MQSSLVETATQNASDIVTQSIKFNAQSNRALVVFDTQNGLTEILTAAYREVLPNAEFVDFDKVAPEDIISKFDQLDPQDLVVLIQSGSFRLNKFRIRINLFNRQLKVIEHMHLYRNLPETWTSYVDSIAVDKKWYGTMAPYLQSTLAEADSLTIKSTNGENSAELVVNGGLEIPKLNIGDYTGMKNIGGTFPIGEVFTEAKDLATLQGSFWVYAHGDTNFEMSFPEKFRVDIKDGLVVSWSDNAPAEFAEVVKNISTQERPIIREIGFGLNRAISKTSPLLDITAFERIVGIHLSLGEKHSVYKKPDIRTHKARFHVDLFVVTEQVIAGSKTVFKNGQYVR